MSNGTVVPQAARERLTEKEVGELLEKVREFQETNQKYLITPATPPQDKEPSIINMANTSI